MHALDKRPQTRNRSSKLFAGHQVYTHAGHTHRTHTGHEVYIHTYNLREAPCVSSY